MSYERSSSGRRTVYWTIASPLYHFSRTLVQKISLSASSSSISSTASSSSSITSKVLRRREERVAASRRKQLVETSNSLGWFCLVCSSGQFSFVSKQLVEKSNSLLLVLPRVQFRKSLVEFKVNLFWRAILRQSLVKDQFSLSLKLPCLASNSLVHQFSFGLRVRFQGLAFRGKKMGERPDRLPCLKPSCNILVKRKKFKKKVKNTFVNTWLEQ